MKKLIKRLQAIFLTAVMLFTLLPDMTIHVSAEAQDVSVYVSETGNDSTGDGSQKNPYATLQQAYAHLYSVNKINGTVDTNKIYIMGTVALPEHLNNKNSSSCNPVAATISGVDGAQAKLDISDADAVRLYAATVLDNLALNNNTEGRLDIRARSNALTVTDTVTTAAGSIGILGGDASGNKFTTTNLTINGGTFSRVVGGSTGGNSNTGSGNTVNINIGGKAVITTLYGGTNHTSSSSRTITVGEVNLSINGGTITNLYMGGQCEHASSASSQTINHATLTMTGGSIQNVYAGGYASKANGTMTVKESVINISGGSIGSLYSGGKMTADAGASNSLTVESAVITISGTTATVGALHGIGQTETDASGVNTVRESKVIFQDAAMQLPALKDVNEIQITKSTEEAVEIDLPNNVTASGNITIDSGVTFDLNGHTLDMGNNCLYSYYGNVVDNSAGKAGRLKVGTYAEGEKENIQAGTPKGNLAPGNSQMPVYIADEGYMFATMTGQGDVTEATGDDFTVTFRPSFGKEHAAKLAKGADDAKLQFIIRLDWSKEGKNYYQPFKCTNDLVQTVYEQAKAFSVTFKGLTGYKAGMKVTVFVKSDLGVEWVNNSHQMTITSDE